MRDLNQEIIKFDYNKNFKLRFKQHKKGNVQ